MVKLVDFRTASTPITELLDDVSAPQRVHWFPETYAGAKTGMVYPPHRLANKVLDPELLKSLRENPSKKTAFILAAGNAHFAGIPANHRESRLTYQYKMLPLTLTQVYAGRIAQSCGATDHVVTDSSACASSLKVLMDVQTLVNHYGFTRVVVLAVEDAVSNLVLEFFGEAKASLTAKREASEGIVPSAFDSKNGSFYIGQGAVFAVFEADHTDAPAMAKILGAYTASEPCNNPLGQLDSGLGFVRAAQGAIELTNITDKDVRVVKTHGTGTVSNNVAERAALKELLPGGFIATSYKPVIGHTMGASGLLETCLLIADMLAGVVPAVPNRTEVDAMYLSDLQHRPDGLMLALAAGMGNVYSAAVLSVGG
jgi:3-oxoacyl-[acyl-carrier-protein] synthase I